MRSCLSPTRKLGKAHVYPLIHVSLGTVTGPDSGKKTKTSGKSAAREPKVSLALGDAVVEFLRSNPCSGFTKNQVT